VVFNATRAPAAQRIASLSGAAVTLHPALHDSADPAVDGAQFDSATGTLTIPARTVAVFVQS
jgi:hypothetical protein